MELCYSYNHIPIQLSSTRKYHAEHIRGMCDRVTGPFWLRVEGRLILLEGEDCMKLACQVSAAYHDWVAYNAPYADGFGDEIDELR